MGSGADSKKELNIVLKKNQEYFIISAIINFQMYIDGRAVQTFQTRKTQKIWMYFYFSSRLTKIIKY